jgi:hypothetical protein
MWTKTGEGTEVPVNIPMRTQGGLSWDPASVELPEMPMIAPGQDALSATIAAVLPTLTAPLTADVAALQAQETMFSGKLGAANAAYENADASGQQSVGQVVSALGQLGQMAQSAGSAGGAAGGGGQGGMFGSLMQPIMQAVQGASGGAGGQSAAGQPAGQPAGGAPAAAGQPVSPGAAVGVGVPQQQPREDGFDGQQDQGRGDERETQEKLQRADPTVPVAAGPDEGRHSAGPVPVTPPEQQRDGEDIARRM